MEEEDDNKREVNRPFLLNLTEKILKAIHILITLLLQQCLRHHMGDEKYQAYAVMVRQLKFLEDVAFKI